MLLRSATMVPWRSQSKLILNNITSADGCFFFKNNNQKIIDFSSGAMVVNLGHNNSYIQRSYIDYINSGMGYVPSYLSTYNREKLSHRLIDISKLDNGKVFYTNAGGDANEIACFLAKEYNHYSLNKKKSRIISFDKSFHGGSTIGASLLSGDSRSIEKRKFYNIPMEPIMNNPKLEDNGESSLKQITKLIKDNKDIGTIVIEGSSGSAGCILYPPKYLKKLETLCREYNILIICDEVMSGFGRTGEMFSHFKQDIKPDIITCAKALTSGYSQLGAVLINSKVSDLFETHPVMCGLTYFGHPLSCTVANSCLDLYLENDSEIIKNVDSKGLLLNKLCSQVAIKYNFIKDYRNNGLLGCFELDLTEKGLQLLDTELLNSGIYCMRIKNNIFTSPPLIIDDILIKETIKKIDFSMGLFESKYLT
jgi:taurine--2-oxoglutarate transaminase